VNYFNVVKMIKHVGVQGERLLKDGTYQFIPAIVDLLSSGPSVVGETFKPVSFDEGFQVSFEEARKPLSPDLYNDMVERCKRAYGDVYVGVYQGQVELSFHIYDFEQAVKMGTTFNQHSIWDWSKGQEIVLFKAKED